MEFLFSHLTSLMSPMPTGGTLMARKEFKDTPDFSRSTVLHFLTASLQGMTGTTALTMLSALGSVFFFFYSGAKCRSKDRDKAILEKTGGDTRRLTANSEQTRTRIRLSFLGTLIYDSLGSHPKSTVI